MYSEERCRYEVLTRSTQVRRSGLPFDKHLAVLFCIVVLPILLFCFSYVLIFGYFQKVIYPVTRYEVPKKDIQRAVIYSTLPENDTSSSEYYLPFDHRVPLKEVQNFKLVCYYNFPDKRASLQVRDLDPFLCTHINAAFARIRNNTIYLDETEINVLKDLVKLKETNKDLKVLVSVGGAGNDEGFPSMVFNHSNRKTFIKSVFDYHDMFKIDGIDLDWEFPNSNPINDKKQKMHFTQLLEELRHAINRRENVNFLITVAVAAPFLIVKNSYDVTYMNEYVDFVNLMSYDYHFYTKTTPFTGHNSPLFSSDIEKNYLATLNINYSTNFWNHLGMDRSKIIVGLPTYGHSFKLLNPDNNRTYAPAEGYGKLGTSGFVCYSEISSFLSSNYISPIFDMDAKSPYASIKSEWVSFDNVQSLTFKTEYIKNNYFGGAMVYSLNCDEYIKRLNNKKFPLINSIKNALSEKPKTI